MPQGTDIGMRASAGAGVTMGFMDVPNSVKEFELAAEAMARGVWYFLGLAARCFFTSALLISIVYSYCLLTWRIIVWSEARRAEGEEDGTTAALFRSIL